MSEAAASFPDLMRDFATAVEGGMKSSRTLPFISLQYSTLMCHRAETDDEKRQLTSVMSGLATHWLTYCSRPQYSGEFKGADKLIHPMLDALQAPQALPFVSPEDVQKVADACLAFATYGPALLEKAGPHDDSAGSVEIKKANREFLLNLMQRSLDFANKCKEFREGIGFDARTSKDISTVKRISLKEPANG